MAFTTTINGNVPTMKSILADLFETDTFFSNSVFKRQWVPYVNVKDADNCFEIDLAAPGLKKEDFNIVVQNGILTISAESRSEKEDSSKKYTRKEFYYNGFSRSFTLPGDVEENSIQAKYEDGLLRLTLNKTKTEELIKKVIHLY